MNTQLLSKQSPTTVNRVTPFVFRAPTAREVALAGDFNNWNPKAGPMHKDPDGMWRLGVPLKPGRYEYRFFADNVWCDDPAAELRTVNAMGTQNCVRIV